MNQKIIIVLLICLFANFTNTLAQALEFPQGNNQKASISQWIGLVEANITFYSPNVIHPRSGEDRTGKIWGELVPYGFNYEKYADKVIPWRVGAERNTVFSVSHDVKIEGKDLPAGKYGLFMVSGKEEWTIIFSKHSNSWGALFYDEKEDALRVTVKPAKTEFTKWLTFDFIEKKSNQTVLALKWEYMMVPFTIDVPNVNELYLEKIRSDLRNDAGFGDYNWVDAVNFCVKENMNLDEALTWADYAINRSWFGRKNYNTLSAKARVLDKLGREKEAQELMEKAIKMATTKEVFKEGIRLLRASQNEKALELFKYNAQKFPEEIFIINHGLAKGYTALDNKKKAIKHWELAIKNIPESIDYQFFLPQYKKALMELKENI